jgi:hypothetical protein
MHANDSAMLTETAEDANPHIAPAAIVQTLAKVVLLGFCEPHIDVLVQRAPCAVLEWWDLMRSEYTMTPLSLNRSAMERDAGSKTLSGP